MGPILTSVLLLANPELWVMFNIEMKCLSYDIDFSQNIEYNNWIIRGT
jgi:hypothetical protein